MCPRLRRPALLALPLALASPLGLVACAETGEPKIEELEPDANTRYELQDRIGSASVILDQEGAVVTHTGVEPYGETWAEDNMAGESGSVYRFTDKELDVGVGTIYIGMRHYVPKLGRWASPDPKFSWESPEAVVSDPQEGNAYRYAANSPVMQVDPDGRDAWEAQLVFSLTIGGFSVGGSRGFARDHHRNYAKTKNKQVGGTSKFFDFTTTVEFTYHDNENGNADIAGTGGTVTVSNSSWSPSDKNTAYSWSPNGAGVGGRHGIGGATFGDKEVEPIGKQRQGSLGSRAADKVGQIAATANEAVENTGIELPTDAIDYGSSSAPAADAQLSTQPSGCSCSSM